jgi:hypothetical protein
VNSILLKKKDDSNVLDFEGFVQFYIQAAILSFSRPPKDISHLPPVESVIGLMRYFELGSRGLGENMNIFRDQEAKGDDTDLIQELNRRLEINPNTIVPEGYSKIVEKEVIYHYKLPRYFNVPKSNQIAVELLDEIISNQFGFHFLEPISDTKVSYKVKKKAEAKSISQPPKKDEDLPHYMRAKHK